MIDVPEFADYEQKAARILVPPHAGTFTLQKWTLDTLDQAEELFLLIGGLLGDDSRCAYVALQPDGRGGPTVMILWRSAGAALRAQIRQQLDETETIARLAEKSFCETVA